MARLRPNWTKIILLTFIVAFSICIKAIRINDRYTFEWDQSNDAMNVMSMVWDKKPVLIGPRVANDNGFFTGPYFYYFLLPFYLAVGGHPAAGAIASVLIGGIVPFLTYFIGEKLYDKRVALLAAIITASSVSIVSWNAMFITPFSLIGYYLCHQLLKSNKLFIHASAFAGFVASFHLVTAPIMGYVALTQLLTKKKATVRQLLWGLIVLALFFTPIAIFDLRHQFLNLNKLLIFIGGQSADRTYPTWYFMQTFWRSLVLSGYVQEKIIILIAFCYAIYKQKDFQSKIITSLWILLPILALSQYKGNIPEYYYGMANALIPLFLAKLFVDKLTIWIIIPVIGLLVYSQFIIVLNDKPFVRLRDKLNVVSYIVNQKEFPVFNVSYDLPLGENTGYQYIFKYFKHEPFSGPEGHLFSISLTSKANEKFVYTSGPLGVIRR